MHIALSDEAEVSTESIVYKVLGREFLSFCDNASPWSCEELFLERALGTRFHCLEKRSLYGELLVTLLRPQPILNAVVLFRQFSD